MNLVSYIKKFGKYDFNELAFNEIDACVLTTAVYSNFEVVAPSIYETNIKATKFKDITEFDLTIVTAGKIFVKNTELIPLMKKSKRFGDVGIKYIYKKLVEQLSNQFYACCYEVPNVGSFVAFRGTDSSIAGWKEDLNIAVNDVILAQSDALNYLNTVATNLKEPIYIGGHSKGGNLALYSCIYTNSDIKNKIKNIYIFDGNGLRNDFYHDKRYIEIKDKIKFYKPKDVFISEIMNNPKDFSIIKSKNVSILQHDTHSWVVKKDCTFKTCKNTTRGSKVRKIALNNWLDHCSIEDRIILIDYITNVLGGTTKTIFDFISSPFKGLSISLNFLKLNKEDRFVIKSSLVKFLKYFKEAEKIYHKSKQ